MNKIRPEITKKAFEEHINPIISNPYNAIIELIANAYDAGATELNIIWPLKNTLDDENKSVNAIFKDNGEGISHDDFLEIWKELSYNRIEKQGKNVKVDFNNETIIREVYGKNGKGRHAPFAFSKKYIVKTISKGELSIFNIEIDSKGFSILKEKSEKTTESSGTEIEFEVEKSNINIETLRETIATRFLKDDSFKIVLNNEIIDLTDVNDENKKEIKCKCGDYEITIIQLESKTKTKYVKFQGLSWKIGNRIIEDKSWNKLLDGRKTIAKKFTYIIDAEILKDYTNDNMTGFIKDDAVEKVKNTVEACIRKSLHDTLKLDHDETKKNLILEELPEIKKLSSMSQEELGQFISNVQESCPDMQYGHLKAVTEIFIKLKKTSTGYDLLKQLSLLSGEDYDKLSDILNEWDIHSAKVVLDEIKWRMNLIKQLEVKMNNPNTDELHELQPLFEKGLWIFGPEYESIEFTSNKALSTVVKKFFKKNNVTVENPKLRPDFVVIPNDRSIGIHSSDHFDENGDVDGINKVLIVEIKKGGFKITLDQIQQTQKYIQQLIDANKITPEMEVIVYILGSNVAVDEQTMGKNITIIPKEYDVILRRAKKRLLNLDKKIREIKKIDDELNDEIMKNALRKL